MSDFFDQLEQHLLTAARRDRRVPPWPGIAMALAGAAVAVALAVLVLPLASDERPAGGGAQPEALDGSVPYIPLTVDCSSPPVRVTDDPAPPELREAYELFRHPALGDALPQEALASLTRSGADGLHRRAVREVRGGRYARIWIVPVESFPAAADCGRRSAGPGVCMVPSDGTGTSCAVLESFVNTGYTRLFIDRDRRQPTVVVGVVPDGIEAALARIGGQDLELPVRVNGFAATLGTADVAGPVIDGVEELDLRWRYADGRIASAFP